MTPFQAALTRSFAAFNRNALNEALAALSPIRRSHVDDPRLAVMLGQILFAQGDYAGAAAPLRQALAAVPANIPVRVKLAHALVALDRLEDARRVAAADPALDLVRVVALIDQRQGRADAAAQGYRRVLASVPQDYESWDNLGLALRDLGDLGAAADAHRRALALQPAESTYHLNLAEALGTAARFEERRQALQQAERALPPDAAISTALGVAEGAVGAFDAAETAFRRALALAPGRVETYHEYGALLERLNRIDALSELVEEAEKAGASVNELAFLHATVLARRGEPREALSALDRCDWKINPARLAELRGNLFDRIGETDAAFAAWTAMNRASAAVPAAVVARALDYPSEVETAIARLVAADLPARARARPEGPTPTFILGFPRSGTTLLDALLATLPGLRVLEEPPMLEQVERDLGGAEGLAVSNSGVLTEGRKRYFDHASAFDPQIPLGTMLVDKFPLHMVRAESLHRLFPDAKILFVERHPLDVILSCFVARFQPNKAMVQFQELTSAARLYDLAMTAWTTAHEVLPLDVLTVRYERLVADVANETRRVADFLGVDWSPAVLDHRAALADRSHVPTASYAQVAQPVSNRSVGRWQRYRKQLAPSIPLLAPWAERMGYTI